jgi:replication fork clamp-binding protein CrfC
MKHMSRAYKPEDAMLRPAKESTLERQEKMRQDKKKPPELNVNSKDDIISKKINERLERKAMLAKAMNKLHDADIA